MSDGLDGPHLCGRDEHRVTSPKGDTLADPHVIIAGDPTPDGHEVILITDDLTHAHAVALAVSRDVSRRLRDRVAEANRRAALLGTVATRLRRTVAVLDRAGHGRSTASR